MKIPIHIHIMLEAWGARLVGTHLLAGNKIVRIPYTLVVRYLLKNFDISAQDVIQTIRGKGLMVPTSPSAESIYRESVAEVRQALAELPRVNTVRKRRAADTKLSTKLRKLLHEQSNT